MCYFCWVLRILPFNLNTSTQFDLCNLIWISVSPPRYYQRDRVQQCVPAQHLPLVVIAIALVCSLFVEMVVKFGGPCALCEWRLRPLAAILGSAEDLSRPRSSGGRGVASGRCREQLSRMQVSLGITFKPCVTNPQLSKCVPWSV